jgi:hypothetical protein
MDTTQLAKEVPQPVRTMGPHYKIAIHVMEPAEGLLCCLVKHYLVLHEEVGNNQGQWFVCRTSHRN